jgi:hypothetical protein
VLNVFVPLPVDLRVHGFEDFDRGVLPPPAKNFGCMPDSSINACCGVFNIPGEAGVIPASSISICCGVFRKFILSG